MKNTTQKEWFEELIEHHIGHYSYDKKALLLAVNQHIKEQQERLKQLQAELDALLWNPTEW
ncbi:MULTISPECIES: hypothetical protein [unclassified Granulicatella]|uniref:hypothetical protein n=1 Tax=unclassified Granulicatella TaxID=2630493 RepID=UPI001073E0B6|nr:MULTISPECIES: hypothetical protein [unclassified Granulicatella]MBF0780847.1 hypothetical protein [Granulicatella sp. 19428wC4_WM01]TFU93514.1 hypothetical protein E4T68_07015 [Granulicatella sp. WM01]